MSEKGMWSTMRVQMGRNKYWREATRHEDKFATGIADLSYISEDGNHGWIELKKLKEWPKRTSTIVRIDHYTEDQRIFLKHKGRRGGYTWLFLQVARDYMLFNWEEAQEVGRVPRAELLNRACLVSENGMDWQWLGRVLCNRTGRTG